MTKSSNYRAISLVVGALAGGAACSDEARVLERPEQPGERDPGDDGSGGDDQSGSGSGSGSGTGSEPDPPNPAEEPRGDPPPVRDPPRGGDGAETPVPPEVPAGNPTPEPLFITPRGPCEIAARVGGFSIEKQVDFGVVQGTVSAGVVPTAIPTVVAQDSDCKLLERRNLACLPACVGVETCGESGSCIPFPRQVSVGEVKISGLTRETVMSPQMPGNSYFAPGADNPPFEVQSKIVLSGEGAGDLAGFQLFGVGSEPLLEAPNWVLEGGSNLQLAWPAPTSDVEATVLIDLNIDQHGISPLRLSCEFDDTGSAMIPASIIDRLISSGVSGFPSGRITRRTADHVELGAGCVDLVVGSPLAASVSVSGFTPCNGPEDCPNDQICNVALQRCE